MTAWKRQISAGTFEAVKLGVKSVVLFPKTPDELKTQTAEDFGLHKGLQRERLAVDCRSQK